MQSQQISYHIMSGNYSINKMVIYFGLGIKYVLGEEHNVNDLYCIYIEQKSSDLSGFYAKMIIMCIHIEIHKFCSFSDKFSKEIVCF